MDVPVSYPRPRLLVFGDLNVDYVMDTADTDAVPQPRAGGTAINAALAFRDVGFEPIVVGAIGSDTAGQYLISALEEHGITAALTRSEQPTGMCVLLGDPRHRERRTNADRSANAVDPLLLIASLESLNLRQDDVVFVATHMLVRHSLSTCTRFFSDIRKLSGRLVADLVPHDLGSVLSADDVTRCLKGCVDILIAELYTIRSLFGEGTALDGAPDQKDWDVLCSRLHSKTLVIRHGRFGIEFETIVGCQNGTASLLDEYPTSFEERCDLEKIGFGDRLTAQLLQGLT